MSSTRSDRGFRFPLQKYSDEKALYTNFRYLQEYLNYIRKNDKVTATLVVAASNSNNVAAADFRADGTGDQSTIQAAVDALPSPGGKIVLLEGTYNLSGRVNFGSKDIVLQGAGAVLSLGTSNSSAAWLLASGEAYFVDLNFTGTGVEGKDIIAGRGNLLVVDRCEFYNISNGRSCVSVPTGAESFFVVSNSRFDDVSLTGSGGLGGGTPQGIIHRDSNSVKQGVVQNNFFSDLTFTNGFFPGDIIRLNNTINVMASNNIIVNNARGVGNGTWTHYWNEGTYVPGDHTGLTLDHGTGLTGLTDDDHTQYLKEKAAGGLASEIPLHTHQSDAEAGELDLDPFPEIMLLGGM